MASTTPPVDMIVGPGIFSSRWAKKYVFGQVAIDCLAGPSEVVVVAGRSASPEYVAADLIAQAETRSRQQHFLLTWHSRCWTRWNGRSNASCRLAARPSWPRACLEKFGALVLARDPGAGDCLDHRIGPEHLHLATKNAEMLVDKMEHAGAISVGHHAPVALAIMVAGHRTCCRPAERTLHQRPVRQRFPVPISVCRSRRKPGGHGGRCPRPGGDRGLTAHAASVDIRRK